MPPSLWGPQGLPSPFSKGLAGLHRTVHLSSLSVTGWGVGLGYRDNEWFALEMNRDNFVNFEITCLPTLY